MTGEKSQPAKKPLTVEEVFRRAELERRVQELVEKAVRDRISMVAGAKAEGKAEGRAEGMVEAKQEAVLWYLKKRFGGVACRDKIRQVKDAETLDRLFDSLLDAGTPEEAEEVVSRVLPQ